MNRQPQSTQPPRAPADTRGMRTDLYALTWLWCSLTGEVGLVAEALARWAEVQA